VTTRANRKTVERQLEADANERRLDREAAANAERLARTGALSDAWRDRRLVAHSDLLAACSRIVSAYAEEQWAHSPEDAPMGAYAPPTSEVWTELSDAYARVLILGNDASTRESGQVFNRLQALGLSRSPWRPSDAESYESASRRMREARDGYRSAIRAELGVVG
jgi:hypothetical protein